MSHGGNEPVQAREGDAQSDPDAARLKLIAALLVVAQIADLAYKPADGLAGRQQRRMLHGIRTHAEWVLSELQSEGEAP